MRALLVALFLLLHYCSANNVKEMEMVADFVKTYEKPTTVTAYLCWKSYLKLVLSARLMKIPTTVNFQNEKEKSLENSTTDTIIVVDLNCPQIQNIFDQANMKKMFRSPNRWLILGGRINRSEIVPEEIEDLEVLFDSEVIVALEEGSGDFQLFLIYKIRPESEWMTEYFGMWMESAGIRKYFYMDVSAPLRRKNLGKHEIRIVFNVDDRESGVNLKNGDQKIKNSKHSVTRWGYYQVLALYQFLNATRVNVFTDNWGYFANGSWNGVIGCMARGVVDLSGTPVFISAARLEYTSYISNAVQTSIKFVFREPPLSYQNNLFLLPFSRAVWFALAGFIVLLMIIIYTSAQWENKKLQILSLEDEENLIYQKLNLSDVAMMVVGAVSQQGSFVELRGSGRMVMFILFLVFLFLFTAYSASIVALLQSSSKQIRTLSDLLNSRLELGVENNAYNIYYFTTAKDPVRKAIYETKVAPQGSKPKFMSLEEGVKKLQKHPFAFNMDVGTGYKIVEKYFFEHEKCGLQEIAYIPLSKPWLTGRKDSPFIEIFKIGLSRLREHGVADRENSVVYSKKPVCRVSGGSFDSVSIIDMYPSLLMLLYGMILAILLLVVEILLYRWKTKHL